MKAVIPFDKYEYYLKSVQSPEDDAEFLFTTYKQLVKKKPQVLGEDFCAAFALCCAWVQLKKENVAHGVDLDSEPLNYGKKHYLPKLNAAQQQRLHLYESDVLGKSLPKADVIAALNFSYFCLKQRQELKAYIANCLARLTPDGILVMDCFGGPACMEPNEHESRFSNFSYFWDQDSYNPITHEAMFYIHFKRKGEKKRQRVFTYDWRMWSIREIRDIMDEVGFSRSVVYWEGTSRSGEGNGVFKRSETGDDCESWVAYVVGQK
ncbi:MAG: class I SAM-dependent methyltransferase [Oligoflexales bacterium]